MTNTIVKISELAKDAGYKSLIAFARLDNGKSQKAVLRAGFEKVGEEMNKGNEYMVMKFKRC